MEASDAPVFAWDYTPPARAPQQVRLRVDNVAMDEVQEPGPQAQLMTEITANLLLRARNYEEMHGVTYVRDVQWRVGKAAVAELFG